MRLGIEFTFDILCILDPMDTKEKTEGIDDAEKTAEEEREYCSSLDRIMCQIVDELNCDMA